MSEPLGLTDPAEDSADAAFVRDLARRGMLADRMAAASGVEQIRLRSGAYEIIWPVVFQRLTRRVELARGHHACASAVNRLESECLDRFQDDVEAVLDDLFRNARTPIGNLEGWIASRLTAATVDGHRRRRGERGALQRPRLPGWLADALGHDPWLTALAVEILVWVGLPTTAGVDVWPLGVWAERRAVLTGDFRDSDRLVADDVERVLAAMRQRPAWYANFVERPLGRKQTPVLPAARADVDSTPDHACLSLVERHEADDARLIDLAATAVAAIEARCRRREDLRSVAVDVITTVFGSGTGAEDLDRPPGAALDEDERVRRLIADPATVDRIVAAIVDICSGDLVRRERVGRRKGPARTRRSGVRKQAGVTRASGGTARGRTAQRTGPRG